LHIGLPWSSGALFSINPGQDQHLENVRRKTADTGFSPRGVSEHDDTELIVAIEVHHCGITGHTATMPRVSRPLVSVGTPGRAIHLSGPERDQGRRVAKGDFETPASSRQVRACGHTSVLHADEPAHFAWLDLEAERRVEIVLRPAQRSPFSARKTKPRKRLNACGDSLKVMGLGRVELPTSRLSGVRSNHLSYRPLATC
jgi:hypothetical protein